MNTAEGVAQFFNPVHSFIDGAINDGKNVLVHCMAGAHRAGTTGVSYLMKQHQIGFQEAQKIAKQQRPVVDPFGDLAELLTRLEASFNTLGYGEPP